MRVFPRGVATGGQMEPSLHLSLPTYWPPVKSSTLGWMKRPTRSLVPATRRGGRTNLWDDCETRLRGGSFLPTLASLLSWLVLPWAMALVHARHTHTHLRLQLKTMKEVQSVHQFPLLNFFLQHRFSPLSPQPFSGNVDLRITASSIGWQLSLESAFNGPLQVINWLLNQLNNQPDRLERGALNSFSEREFLKFVTPKPLPALFNKN